MKPIPPHRVASAHSFIAGLHLSRGRADMAEIEVFKLTSWIVLQQGVGRE